MQIGHAKGAARKQSSVAGVSIMMWKRAGVIVTLMLIAGYAMSAPSSSGGEKKIKKGAKKTITNKVTCFKQC